jgi:GGDEF domain-containing protein
MARSNRLRKNQEMNKPYELSASVGFINAIPDKSDTLIEFIQQADAEMYLVKKLEENKEFSSHLVTLKSVNSYGFRPLSVGIYK